MTSSRALSMKDYGPQHYHAGPQIIGRPEDAFRRAVTRESYNPPMQYDRTKDTISTWGF